MSHWMEFPKAILVCPRCREVLTTGGLHAVGEHECFATGVDPIWFVPADRLDAETERAEQIMEKRRDALDQLAALREKAEPLKRIADMVRESDVVILLTKGGQAGYVRFKSVGGSIPWDVTTHYGEPDDPPGTIRQVSVKAGWPKAKWRSMDRTGLHDNGEAARERDSRDPSSVAVSEAEAAK